MNNQESAIKPPTWFWVVGGIALLWNLMGLAAFVMQMLMMNSPDMMAQLPADQAAIFETMPMWVKIAFGIAVIAGTVGSLLLLLRTKLAMPVLLLSLLGVLAQQSHMFFLSDTFKVMGAGAMVFPLIVLAIAIGLVVFASMASKKFWLR